MICPLHDCEGNPRKLSTIEFNDLAQLESIEEGYAVEYKSTWDDAVKAKLQKIITSFANANGGWLFVGIDNNGVFKGIPRNRADFDQTIAQIVHRHVTPLPRFDTRYIVEPGTENGVLVVEVFEGLEPPYIADGSVFIRVGSSSEKFVSKADSYVLIDLHRKARKNRAEIEDFCHRTVFFPPTQVNNGICEYRFPITDVYLKHLYPSYRPFISFAEIDEEKKTMLGLLSRCGLDQFICQHAHSSLIFRNDFGNCVDDVSPAIELFYDGSIKIYLPLSLIQPPNIDMQIERLQSIRQIRNTNLVRLVDGSNLKSTVITVCFAVDEYISAKSRTLRDYALAYEFENMQGTIMVFDDPTFEEYAHKYGFPFFSTIDERTKPRFFQFDLGMEKGDIAYSVLLRLFEGFGLPFATTEQGLRSEVDALLGLTMQMEEPSED